MLFDGVDRAPAHSYRLNIGFTHDDPEKPILGVPHG
jgi:hypothetical protein